MNYSTLSSWEVNFAEVFGLDGIVSTLLVIQLFGIFILSWIDLIA
jgi:hypothetical protein